MELGPGKYHVAVRFGFVGTANLNNPGYASMFIKEHENTPIAFLRLFEKIPTVIGDPKVVCMWKKLRDFRFLVNSDSPAVSALDFVYEVDKSSQLVLGYWHWANLKTPDQVNSTAQATGQNVVTIVTNKQSCKYLFKSFYNHSPTAGPDITAEMTVTRQ